MSIFRNVEVSCPSCRAAVLVEPVHSVNAVRRPDLRAAILSGEFQRMACTCCGVNFRLEPEFSYLDAGRRQFFVVRQTSKIAQCCELESRATALFENSVAGSRRSAQWRGVLARVVFGWAGLREKLVACDAGVDDRILEVAKVAVMRTVGDMKLGPDCEFRLLSVTADMLTFGWLRSSTEELDEELSVPRELLSEIERQGDDWQALQRAVAGPMFVDYRRSLLGLAS